jgi:hypothetical protein
VPTGNSARPSMGSGSTPTTPGPAGANPVGPVPGAPGTPPQTGNNSRPGSN